MASPRPRPDGLDKPIARHLVRYLSAANTWLYRRTDGRVGGRWRVMAGFRKPAPVLLLTVVGRRTGEPRTVPLLYAVDGDGFVVVASSGGMPQDPQWLRNLVANPEVEVQVGADVRPMLATVADDGERRRLWSLAVAVYEDFDTYDEWTERQIPVVRLAPR